jgi:hypothetical protein
MHLAGTYLWGTQTRVILDIGAQVIDLTNLEFAKKWLACYSNDETARQSSVSMNMTRSFYSTILARLKSEIQAYSLSGGSRN